MNQVPSKSIEARLNLQNKLDTAREVYATMLKALKYDNLTVDDLNEEQKNNMEILSELIHATQELLDRYGVVN